MYPTAPPWMWARAFAVPFTSWTESSKTTMYWSLMARSFRRTSPFPPANAENAANNTTARTTDLRMTLPPNKIERGGREARTGSGPAAPRRTSSVVGVQEVVVRGLGVFHDVLGRVVVQRVADSDDPRAGAGGETLHVERGHAGDVGRGHRRPADGVRGAVAAVPRRGDAEAGSEEVDAVPVIGPGGLVVARIGGADGDGARRAGRRVLARVLGDA